MATGDDIGHVLIVDLKCLNDTISNLQEGRDFLLKKYNAYATHSKVRTSILCVGYKESQHRGCTNEKEP